MSVGKVCIREVVFAQEDETARDAAERMRAERVGTLVVLDDVLDLLAEEFSTIGELLSRQEPRTHRRRP